MTHLSSKLKFRIEFSLLTDLPAYVWKIMPYCVWREKLTVTFYHNGCPKCKVLKKKLDAKQVEYLEETDSEILISKGFKSVPVLEIDGKVLNFMDAVNWVNGR